MISAKILRAIEENEKAESWMTVRQTLLPTDLNVENAH